MTGKLRYILVISILFLLLLLPAFYAMGTAIDMEYSVLKKMVYLAVVIGLLLIPALVLKCKTYFIVEGIFNFFFFPIDIASLYLNKQSTSTPFLQIILQTDFHEATELLSSFWPLCMVVIALWVLYFVLASRLPNTYMLHRRARIGIVVVFGIVILGGICYLWRYERKMNPTRSIATSMEDVKDDIVYKFYKIYPYNLYLELSDITRARIRQHQMQQQVASFHFGIHPSPNQRPALYVLVIGEAARYDHWSINGYTRETSPLLTKRTHLISYDSVYAQANLTSQSVPLILTRATALDPETAYKEKALPEAFQEASYQTGLITKQPPLPLTGRLMNTCDKAHFYSKGVDVDGNYDAEMIAKLQEYIQDTMQFIVLHSLGCHFRYEQRYPQEFARFQPTFGHSFNALMIAEENKDKVINAYDNAILYTDYFLDALIQSIDSLDREAVVVYISDHGESFWDDDRKLALHGSYVLSGYEYHVPLFVWYSDEYAALYPQKVQAMQQNKTTPVSSDVVFYSMLDMAGIEEMVDSTRSICSPSLTAADTVWVRTGSGVLEALPIH